MTVFLSRSAWGALPPNRQSADRTTTTHLFVHHSATLNPTSTPRPDDIEESKEQWSSFQADHLDRPVSDTNPTKWADLAYNIGVGPGVILEGRGWDAKGGGTGKGDRLPHPSGSWDNVSVSICVIGNYQNEHLDPLTRASLIDAMREAHTRYGDLTVMVDRDVNFTSCCGDNLIPLVPQLWAEAIGDDMTPDQFAAMLGPLARNNNGVIEILLRDGDWHSFSEALSWTHTEAQDAANKPAVLAEASAPPYTIVLSGTATPG